jgi:3-isopropylmalate/(R)-2-methylmalate dehydratase small subunit
MVPKQIIGKAWCYGDNINTDLIYSGRYLTITEPKDMAKHAMADIDAEFGENFCSGDIVIAGENFGCGSSREQAVLCLKYAGVNAIIAKSFARIFYRNAINQGIPTLICKESVEIVKAGDYIELDLTINQLKNNTNNKSCEIEPLPNFLLELIENGGIIPFLKKKLNP